jgi:hypothetical protein
MNTKIKDGGPAFPETRWNDITRSDVQWQGMSLRDWFAGMALQGACANAWEEMGNDEQLAAFVYATADAMIAKREKGKQ